HRKKQIKILSNTLNYNTTEPVKAGITLSEQANSWNNDQIARACTIGQINGKGNSKFAPAQSSTRAEALTIVMNALCLDPEIKALMDQLSN
ncbi:hypothetical protein AMQ83_02480, partial [Paenibacillus riograndensis]